MNLIPSLLAALKSSLLFWEIIEYSATGIVILGAVGEYFAEFRDRPRDESERKKFAKLSALVLIGGLALELLGLVRTSQISGQTIATLNQEAKEAGKDA